MASVFEFIDHLNSTLRNSIFIFGLLYLLYISIKIICIILNGINIFILARLRKVDLMSKYGELVVITGATDGIGLAFAEEFAERGHSIVIIGRNEEKLRNAKETVGKLLKPGKYVETIKVDLNSNDASVFYNIKTQLMPYKHQIGILINNAGVSADKPVRFLEMEEEEVMQTVRVNISAVLMVIRMVLPFMVENKRGLVINMSSITSINAIPFTGVYCAGKKLLSYFGHSLRYEYKNYNIDVLTFVPGFVVTKMLHWSDRLSKPSLTVPSTKAFAKSAIATIGHTNHTTGYWSHGIQWMIGIHIPVLFWELFADYSRQYYLRKQRANSVV